MGLRSIGFDFVGDASGDTARIDVDFLLGGAVVETARIRVAEGEDRAVALSAEAEFDGLRLSDAEGDVTFALSGDVFVI
ncbi:MAG: hypothetical protein AAGE76_16815 [Pseudomonadota bacterium]